MKYPTFIVRLLTSFIVALLLSTNVNVSLLKEILLLSKSTLKCTHIRVKILQKNNVSKISVSNQSQMLNTNKQY